MSVAEILERLNKTSGVDDDEIQDMIDAAEAYYTRVVGPLTGTVTEKLDGGGPAVVLATANVSAITEAVYADGTAISVDDLDLNTQTGIVYWGYGTAGRFAYGSRNVEVTYTIGTLPADHRETIIADVAGYFAATQRGGGAGPSFSSEGLEEPLHLNPVKLFPRIAELAKSNPAVA